MFLNENTVVKTLTMLLMREGVAHILLMNEITSNEIGP